jgi:ATP-dependent helicase/nuclease subunit B
MTPTFIHYVCELLQAHYGSNLKNVTLVTPNRRAALFFNKTIKEVYTTTTWLPNYITIEEFIYSTAQLKSIDNLQALMELYACHLQLKPEQTFVEFAKWGNVALNDFNDIEKHAVPAKAIFNYLTEVKAIEQWTPQYGFAADKLTEFQQKYFEFWNSLHPLFELYRKTLIEKQTVTQSIAANYAFENFDQLVNTYLGNDTTYVFVGFNAFTKSEERLIAKCAQQGNVKFVWDIDNYYYKNDKHEAGRFFRAYMQRDIFATNTLYLPSELIVRKTNLLATTTTNITTYPAANGANMVAITNKLINQLVDDGIEQADIAVVLAQENMLLPMLYALPERINYLNITMGYPVNATIAYHLCNSFFKLFKNTIKNAKKGIYYTFFTEIIAHSLIKNHVLGVRNYKEINDYLILHNLIKITPEQLHKLLAERNITPLFSALFDEDTVENKINSLVNLLIYIKDKIGESNAIIDSFNTECISAIASILLQLNDTLKTNKLVGIGYNDILLFFNSMVNSMTVTFRGEPLLGMQIMGVLETRMLDFKHVIVVGVNEGVIPAKGGVSSFLTYDVKLNFGMNSSADNDSIFSYHFYHLLKRCSSAHLLYIEGESNNEVHEKSRFILQIENELLTVNKNISYKKINYSVNDINSAINDSITIQKTPDVMEGVKEKLSKGMSPTAFASYIACPLQFYFKYVQKLYDEDELSDIVDSKDYGSIFHQAIELLTKPYLGKELTKTDIAQLKKDTPKTIKEAYFLIKKNRGYDSGENLITINTIEYQLRKYFDFELSQLNTNNTLVIAEIETDLKYQLTVNDTLIQLTGKADRLDMRNGIATILDYKTGKASKSDLIVKTMEMMFENQQQKIAFQTFFYSYLVHQQKQQALASCIYSTKNSKDGLLYLNYNGAALLGAQDFAEFEQNLITLLTTILDTDLPFTQTDDIAKVCSYCSFNTICNRETL